MTLTLRRRAVLTAAAALMLCGPLSTAAFASDVITLIVPYAGGGINDAFGRKVADGLSRDLGRTVLVENKPGANGIIGATYVANAPKDGSVLLLGGTGPISLNAMLRQDLPYKVESFQSVALMFEGTLTISVPTSLGVNSLDELVAHAKSTGKPLRYSTQGPGSVMDLYGRIIGRHFGIEMVPVAYKNNPASIVDFLAGQLDVSFVSPMSLSEHAKSGAVKILALTVPERDPAFADVPTVAELGHPQIETSYWTGLHAPAGTPDEIVQSYAKSIINTVNAPDFLELLSKSGQYPKAGGPETLDAQLATDRTVWAPVIAEMAAAAKP